MRGPAVLLLLACLPACAAPPLRVVAGTKVSGPALRTAERGRISRITILHRSGATALEWCDAPKPLGIHLDGRLLDRWSYDPDRLCTTIPLPNRPTGHPLDVEIDNGPNPATGRAAALAWRALAADVTAAYTASGESFRWFDEGKQFPAEVRRDARRLALNPPRQALKDPARVYQQASDGVRRLLLRDIRVYPQGAPETEAAICALTHAAPSLTLEPKGRTLFARAGLFPAGAAVPRFTWETPEGWRASVLQKDASTLALSPPDWGVSPGIIGVVLTATWQGIPLRFRRTVPMFQWARSFAVLGPFSEGTPGGLSPENDPFDASRTYPGRDGPVLWRAAMGVPAMAEWDKPYELDLGQLFPVSSDAFAYVALSANVPRVTLARLWAGSDGPFALWVNGERLASVEDRKAIGIRLEEGPNFLLFRVAPGRGKWRISARLTDSDGAPIPGLRLSAPVGSFPASNR